MPLTDGKRPRRFPYVTTLLIAAGMLTRSGQRHDRRAEQGRHGYGARPIPQNG